MAFELIDAFEWLRTRDFAPEPNHGGAVNPLNPFDARPFQMGEFVTINNDYRIERGGNNAIALAGTADGEAGANTPSWPIYMEVGRYDAQAIAGNRGATGATTLLWSGTFEARTTVCNSLLPVAMTVGAPVSIWDIDTFGTTVCRGLHTRNTGWTIGFVTRLNGNHDIRFVRNVV
tara:strand:+ start:1142 stop:1666 length:525 start_codon:yes stop_codon:yes gene_type:complete